MLQQEASIPSLFCLSVLNLFYYCQRNLYLGQAVARMLYSGVKTADDVLKNDCPHLGTPPPPCNMHFLAENGQINSALPVSDEHLAGRPPSRLVR